MDVYGSVKEFERAIANYSCAPYAVGVDSCSNALALCCQYLRVSQFSEIEIPAITYPSVASAVVHAGGRLKFDKRKWQNVGWFELRPVGIVDSAKYLSRNMFTEIKQILSHHDHIYICLSFHAKKAIPIGRGGVVLTNDKKGAKWLKIARLDGRNEKNLQEDKLVMAGWNCYMTPEQASRGLVLMQWLSDYSLLDPDPYTDLSAYDFFTAANRGITEK